VRHRLPRLPRTGLVAVSTVALVAGWFAVSSSASRIPADGSMAGHGPVDLGGGPAHPLGRSGPHGTHAAAAVDIRTLAGPRNREPDVRVSLTARTARLTLASGERFDAWTFDGTSPGPELRLRQGDLLEVTLVNADIPAGVTLHWHGLDVPNAEDGVAGLTQDAVHPGQWHVYRFVAEQVGSYWYHSHQQSDEQVRRGLFGALVVEPAIPVAGEDLVVLAHAWPTDHGRTTGLAVTGHAATSGVVRRRTAPGTRVRLRLVNADNEPRGYAVTGTSFRVTAIDGSDLPGPPEVTGRQVLVGGGGRYDVEFTMPSGPVGLTLTRDDNAGTGTSAALALSRDGAGEPPPPGDADVLDPARYGTSGDAVRRRFTGAYDRRFTLLLGESFTFFDGRFGQYPTVNGRLHPGTPPLSVRRGDLVRVTLLSRSFEDHPMHLHGHHMLVLSRNGRPATGSPWWTDTLNVAPGERYDVAFRADNPGLWMDHCHNLDHAADGMTLHLEYQGYRTPFRVGPATGNTPE
jgi:FtsP/CotA-like multicopper oxidase with cupredoxin domain